MPALVGSKSFNRGLVGGAFLVNLLVIGLAAYFLNHNYNDTQRNAEISGRNIAQALAQGMESTIDRVSMGLYNVADVIYHSPKSSRNLEEVLTSTLRHLPEIDSMGIASSNGDIINWTGGVSKVRANIYDRDYFQYLKDVGSEEMVITTPLNGRITGKPQIVFVIRLNQADGSFGGVVYAVILIDRIVETFSHLDVGPHGVVILKNSALATVARYPRPDNIGYNNNSKELLDIITKQPTSGTYLAKVGADNLDRTVSYVKMGMYPLYIFTALATQDHMKKFWQICIATLALVILFAVATAIVVRLVYNHQKESDTHLAEMQKKSRVLQESESRYRGLVETQDDFVVRINFGGNFTFVNSALSLALGKDMKDIIGHPWHIAIYPDDINATGEAISRILGGHVTRAFIENRVVETVGIRWIAWDGCGIYDLEGNIFEVQAVGRDITERRQIEEKLQ